MSEVALILAVAAAAFAISQALRLPSVPVLILAGVGLSLAGLTPSVGVLQEFAILGLSFLVFSAGTELNPARFGRHLAAAIVVGVFQFVLLTLLGTFISAWFGYAWITAIYIGLGLAASSTLVVVRLLQQREQLFESFGRLVLGVLLVQDVLVIFAIAILPEYFSGFTGMLLSGAQALALFALAGAFLRWFTPFLLARFVLDDEATLLIVLAILFIFAGVSELLGLPLVVGTFLAGFSLSRFPVNGLVRGQLISLSTFFLVLFFVPLGALLRLPETHELLLAALLAGLVVTITPVLVTILAERAGFTARAGIEAGLLLAQTSEFSVILALVGLDQGHLDAGVLSLMTLVTVVTMMLTPLLATHRRTWRLMRIHPSRNRLSRHLEVRDHILLLGCGETGRLLIDDLAALGRPLVIVDNDPALVGRLREQGYQVIRGDGADFRLLQAVGAPRAAVVVSTMSRLKDHLAILKLTQHGRVVCRVFEEYEAHLIRERGGVPVDFSEAAADEVMAWFRNRFLES